MKTVSTTNDDLKALIAQGQVNFSERIEDLKDDFDQKHKENVERRHQLGNQYATLEGRVTVVETTLRSIVGDNTGGTGLLHEIKNTVYALKDEMSLIKQTVQDTPKINKYIYGVMAVLAFLAVVVPIGLTILFGVIELVFRFMKH